MTTVLLLAFVQVPFGVGAFALQLIDVVAVLLSFQDQTWPNIIGPIKKSQVFKQSTKIRLFASAKVWYLSVDTILIFTILRWVSVMNLSILCRGESHRIQWPERSKDPSVRPLCWKWHAVGAKLLWVLCQLLWIEILSLPTLCYGIDIQKIHTCMEHNKTFNQKLRLTLWHWL